MPCSSSSFGWIRPCGSGSPRAPRRARESKAVTPEQLVAFLAAFRTHYPQHYALVVLLGYTGLRFCHASALRWEDWDEEAQLIRVVRKHRRGKVGKVSRKTRATKEYPVPPELAEVLGWHRRQLVETQARAAGVVAIHEERVAEGWMFPSAKGTLRTPNSLDRAWEKCLAYATIEKRFTVHGLRFTFNDLLRKAKVDPVTRRELIGHVTEEMQRHYSTVDLAEKRAAVASVFHLVPLTRREDRGDANGDLSVEGRQPLAEIRGKKSGDSGGDSHPKRATAG